MKKPVQEKSADDEPVCICGYPRTGLPAIDTPCPEYGSIVAAAYKGSFSYYGWNATLLSLGAGVLHFLILLTMISARLDIPEDLFFTPWWLCTLSLGGLSLFFTVMSMFMREQKRRSLRNIILAIASVVVLPIVGFVILLAMAF